MILQGWLIKAFFNPTRLVINSYHNPKLKLSDYDQKIAWYGDQQRDTLTYHEIELSQVVSEKYWSLGAVNHFLTSLENGRAESMSEAIHYYEMDAFEQREVLRHQQLQADLRAMDYEISKAERAAKKERQTLSHIETKLDDLKREVRYK